jgi:hypothetical protein
MSNQHDDNNSIRDEMESRLIGMDGKQVSLNGVSKWMVNKRIHATLMLSIWIQYFSNTYIKIKMIIRNGIDGDSSGNEVEHLLNLLYLANDVMQSSVRVCGDLFPKLFSPVSCLLFVVC